MSDHKTPVRTFFARVLQFFCYIIGIAIGVTAMTTNFVATGVAQAFVAGLIIWPLWTYCLVPATPYMAAPITYLQAVGIYVLFRLFFGKLLNIKVGEILNGREKQLIEIVRSGPKTPQSPSTAAARPGSNYQPGERQAFRPASEGPACDARSAGDEAGRRQQGATARA